MLDRFVSRAKQAIIEMEIALKLEYVLLRNDTGSKKFARNRALHRKEIFDANFRFPKYATSIRHGRATPIYSVHIYAP